MKDNLLVKTYQFDFILLGKLTLEGFTGTVFRGVFGHALKATCCSDYSKVIEEGLTEIWLKDHKKEDCSNCIKKPLCLYSFLFESTSPHPFVIKVKNDLETKQVYEVGDTISFQITLFGYTNYYLPIVMQAAKIMGEIGFGKNNKKAQLKRVCILHPFYEAIYDNEINNKFPNIMDIYADTSIMMNDLDNIPDYSANYLDEIKIRLLSPLKVDPSDNTDREFYQMILDNDLDSIQNSFFYHFFVRLQRRIKEIGNKYGKLLCIDFDSLLFQEAKMIKTVFHSSIVKTSPYSNRIKDKFRFYSFLGEIYLSGNNLDLFLPILAVGEIIHFGRLTSAGYGQYEIWIPN